MSYRFELVTAATEEPVTRIEAEDHLKVDYDEHPLIETLIKAARGLIESQTARQLVTATWKMHLDGFPCGDIQIRKCPVASVSSITYYDTNGDQQTWDSSLYEVDTAGSPARIRPACNVSYPSTRHGKLNAVTVNFTAGQARADVPREAKQAILLLVSHWFDNREAVARGGYQAMPFAAGALIDSLKWTDYSGGF